MTLPEEERPGVWRSKQLLSVDGKKLARKPAPNFRLDPRGSNWPVHPCMSSIMNNNVV